MRRAIRIDPDQASLFGYISPVTGEVCTHLPLCACGECPMPVETFGPQAAVSLVESVPEDWQNEPR